MNAIALLHSLWCMDVFLFAQTDLSELLILQRQWTLLLGSSIGCAYKMPCTLPFPNLRLNTIRLCLLVMTTRITSVNHSLLVPLLWSNLFPLTRNIVQLFLVLSESSKWIKITRIVSWMPQDWNIHTRCHLTTSSSSPLRWKLLYRPSRSMKLKKYSLIRVRFIIALISSTGKGSIRGNLLQTSIPHFQLKNIGHLSGGSDVKISQIAYKMEKSYKWVVKILCIKNILSSSQ